MKFSEGDYVKVISREQTPDDVKSGAYYPHFAGMAGVVDRVYDGEVCVRVDAASMPQGVLKRHGDIQESIRKKWLNNLSGEARSRLSAEDRQFELAYTILVRPGDLEKSKQPPAKAVAAAPEKEARPVSSKALDAAEQEYLKEKALKMK